MIGPLPYTDGPSLAEVPQRIQYKLSVLMYRCLNRTALSAPLPHTASSKRPQISPFWTILFIVTLYTLTMYSGLLVVYTAYCALQVVPLTLHYITIVDGTTIG